MAELKALVVDDEPLLLEVWRALLDMLPCDVTTVASGNAAVAALQNETFDLVITDVRMPDGDGFEVLNYLRGQQHPARVYLCSGYLDDESNITASYDIAGIIRKPFSFAEQLAHFRGLSDTG